ncbi:MAG: hypothetical protein WDZ35_10495 [Crocinitomicaceae bacterium]
MKTVFGCIYTKNLYPPSQWNTLFNKKCLRKSRGGYNLEDIFEFFCKMVRVVLSILLLVPFFTSSQMLLNPKGEVLEEMPFFNPDFIKSLHIKSFRGTYATKFNQDIIRPNDDTFVYEFDRLGQLVRKYKIRLNDTLVTTYQYDYKGNVIVLRESNKYGFHEYRYKYDQRDRLIEMELRRDKKPVRNKLSFELDENTVVAKEKYEYLPLGEMDYKRLCYNQSGRIYKTEFYYFNDRELLAKKESALHNGNNRVEVNYFYNEQDKITEVKTRFISSEREDARKIFTYDEAGNVLSRHIYNGKQLLIEEQLVYKKEDNTLKAILSREANEAMITILQFKEYRFY